MADSAKTLKRWRRLMSVQTAQRDALSLQQRELQAEIALAANHVDELVLANHQSTRTLAFASLTADVALRSAASSDQKTRLAAIKPAQDVLQSLNDENERVARERLKYQRVISVLETRIDECLGVLRREAR